jgi:multiple sugar transport system ATP-binding protein
MAQVVYDEVGKAFGEVQALKELSLTAGDGEFLVLVGPSGCGKTTALRCLAGLEDPDEGRIYIGDDDVTDVEPKDRDIAMVFQNYALYPYLTARDNMAFGLKLRKTPKPERYRRVQEAADMLGIGDLLDRKPRELSGGQRQRVALGRAIVRDPQVFLMDEPLSNLDAKLRAQTRTEIVKLQRRLGTTMIYVTHDQVEAMTMGSRIAVLNQGVLQQVDTPRRLYDQPANLFVASFIGSPAMNLVPASVDHASGSLATSMGVLRLTDIQREALGRREQVVLGLRPEDVGVAHGGEAAGAGVLTMPVEIVESLGSDLLVYGPEEAFVVRLPAEYDIQAGEVLRLRINPATLRLFDVESGARLDPPIPAPRPATPTLTTSASTSRDVAPG